MLFQQKEFAQAAERFMEAYTLANRPTLIYNAARSYEEAGNIEKALALYRAYHALPDVNQAGRADADSRIERLGKIIDAKKQAEQAVRAAQEAQERERLAKIAAAKDQEAKDRAAAEAKERQAKDLEAKVRLAKAAEDAKRAAPRPFPTLAASTTAGMTLVSASLYGFALSEAAAAKALEAKLHNSSDGNAYFEHVSRATAMRNAAIATGVLATGCAAWLVWELFAERSGPAAPTTTIIRHGLNRSATDPDIDVTIGLQSFGVGVRF
ncbi:MAG: hypothetical protein EXR77_10835 [Myxococcales bacterium]|nr:hypothetical protein [Myxococcales bacterium]